MKYIWVELKQDKNKPHSLWIISKKEEMEFLINNLNGLIRLKLIVIKKHVIFLE